MYTILGSFKLSEPATKSREIINFNSNYTTGRALDYSDSSTFVFNSSNNDFKYDGITFNSISPVDKYGLQENFIFPSSKLRRKEMWWESSSHPVEINSSNNSGFMLFGNYIAVKKISSNQSFSILFSSISSIDVYVKEYNSSTGSIKFGYSNLPAVYTEKDSSNLDLYDFSDITNWHSTIYEKSLSNGLVVKTLYGEIQTNEKIKEIQLAGIEINQSTNEITGFTSTNLSQNEIDSISMISPDIQKIRVITVGEFLIEKNTDGIMEATAVSSSPSRSDLGVSSYIYVNIPYQTGGVFNRSSKEFYVRAPVLPVTFSTGNMFLFAVAVEKTGNQNTPDGFKVGLA